MNLLFCRVPSTAFHDYFNKVEVKPIAGFFNNQTTFSSNIFTFEELSHHLLLCLHRVCMRWVYLGFCLVIFIGVLGVSLGGVGLGIS